jgi:chromosome segregation ATPase
MEGDALMSEQPPIPPTSHDFPDHWGFYLLQEINRLNDNIDAARRDQDRATETLRQEIGSVRQEFGSVRQEIGNVRQEIGNVRQEIGSVRQEFGSVRQEIGNVQQEIGSVRQEVRDLDAKFDQKLTNLQYWYWGTLVVIIMGFVTLFFARP